MWTFRYQDGTITIDGASLADLPPGFVHDDRVGAPRGPAFRYAEVALDLHRSGRPFTDEARAWHPTPLQHRAERVPRDYQRAALDAWVQAGRQGTVVLPTGAGKTFVAELAIATSRRPTLVVAPTLDLVAQWHRRLSLVFGIECGILGGGQHTLADITISTYDSAYRHLGRYGDRFGLLIWDEVHHLPAPGYLESACCAMAPFRLGLTATYERDDGREELLDDILGPVVYRVGITDLAGRFLADYDTVQVTVHLSQGERERYDACRKEFREFCTVHSISLGGRHGFQNFLRQSARSKAGRSAFRAYREYKSIAHGTESKIKVLAELLVEEHGRRTIVFTNDNATAFRVSRLLLLPCITHHTPVKERKHLLTCFSEGSLPTLVTSKVLNEGVDMPEAEVAIVVSGSGTVREHVQRLGRILRPRQGKRAVLYELVAADTTEVHASERRRKRAVYGGDEADADA